MSHANKQARRDHAREVARRAREAERRRTVRNRAIIIALSSIGGLGIIALVVVLVISVTGSTQPAPAVAGPANMASDGILMTGDGTTVAAILTDPIPAGGEASATDPDDYPGTVNLVTYIDYMCPFCGDFESANGDRLMDWVRAGEVTLEVHPISILDRLSQGTEYSTRAANAAACVADHRPDAFLDANRAFFDAQPQENTEGLTDAELLGLLADVGVDGADVTACVEDGEFEQWTADAYERLMTDGVPNSDVTEFTGTPFVTIDGIRYTGAPSDAEAFRSLVEEAIAAKR